MDFPGVNPLAVVAAGGVSFLLGGVWYNVFGDMWLKAVGKTYEQLKAEGGMGARPMAIALLAQLVMAYVLAAGMSYLGKENVTLTNGLLSGLFVWAGFIMTTLLTNNQFQYQGFRLTLVDGGHWLLVLLVQGAIIGFLGL